MESTQKCTIKLGFHSLLFYNNFLVRKPELELEGGSVPSETGPGFSENISQESETS